MTRPSSNKLIVVGAAIVKSPAVRLTVLFLMRNKKKGGAAQILSGDKQKVMRITPICKCRDRSLDLIPFVHNFLCLHTQDMKDAFTAPS